MSKLPIEFKDGKISAGFDSNEDGENSVGIKLELNEALQEAIKRGESKPDAKLVDIKFTGTKLKLILDTDKDEEHLLELEVDLMEVYDEIIGEVAK